MADYSDFGHHRVQRLFYRSARSLALTAVVVAPWLFASAEPWAYLFVCLISAGSFGMFLLSKICFPERHVVGSALTLTLAALLALVVVQSLPMPKPVANLFSPVAVEAAESRIALFQEMDLTVSPTNNSSRDDLNYLSAAPTAANSSIFLFVGYLGIFIVLANTIRSWKHIEKMTTVIIISSFLLVIISLLHKFSGVSPKQIFWFHRPHYPGDVFGPFTNRNHFAFHMLMVFSLTLGLFCSGIDSDHKKWLTDWRERIAWIDPQHASKMVLLGFVLVLFGATILISLSRGAVLSLVVTSGIMWLLLSRLREREGGRVMLWALAAMIIAFSAWIGWEALLMRMGRLAEVMKDPLADTRAVATRDTLMVFMDFPLFGCGFGSFKHVFPIHQGLALGPGIFLHAHNDWAQLFAEGGLFGGVGFLIAVYFFFKTIRRHYPKAIGRARRYVLSLLCGIIAVMLHSFLDYSLHKPANAFLLSALAGLLMATVHMAAVWETSAEAGKTRKHIVHRLGVKERIIPLVALILLSCLVTMEMGCLREAVAFERFCYAERMIEELQDNTALDKVVGNALTDVAIIQNCDTCSPRVLREIAAALVAWSLNEGLNLELRTRVAEQALEVAALSVYYAPTDYLGWLWLGRVQSVLGQWDNSSISLERAKELRPYGMDVTLFEYAE